VAGSERLRSVLRAWELTPALHELEPGVPPAVLDEAEALLGRALPDDLRALYEAVGGGGALHGNLTLYPPVAADGDEDDLTLAGAAAAHRAWDWPVPEELVVFGDNGQGDLFGVWLPGGDDDARPLVVEVGGVFEPETLAVVGTDLAAFLTGWSAYYLLLVTPEHDTAAGLDALGVPDELRTPGAELDDDDMAALLAWASPDLPDPAPDPYERGLTAEQVAAHARRR
jgi:hypothetical protein